MTKDEALKMAIEWMIHGLETDLVEEEIEYIKSKRQVVLEACKEALEQPSQEQSAFMDEVKYGQSFMMDGKHVPLETLYKQPAQKHDTWIDVNDKLPEPEINFLSFSETYGYQVSMYSNNPFNSTLLPTFEKLKIKKWMPIPVYTHPAQLLKKF
jgi:hypothetical protein